MRFLVAFGLAALCGCAPWRPSSVRIDPALATLVPADTVLMAGVRLEALRAAPLYKKLGPEAGAFGDTGIDFDKVWEVLAASDGRRTALLARGKLSESGLEPRIEIPGATRSTYRGYPLTATDRLAVAFVNPTTAVAGQPEAVKEILDQRGRSNGPPAALEKQIELIPPQSQIWAVGIGSPELARAAPRAGNLANLSIALRLVSSFRVYADVGAGVRIEAVALCHKDEDAQTLSGALRFFALLAGLNASGDLRIGLNRNELRVEASISPEAAGKLGGRALQR